MLRTASFLNFTSLDHLVPDLIIFIGILLTPGKAIVKLMIYFSPVKGKVFCIMNIHHCLAEVVGIVTFAFLESYQAICCGFEFFQKRRLHASGQADQVPVFAAAVALVGAVSVFVEQLKIGLGEIQVFILRNTQPNYLSVAELAILRQALAVMIANEAILRPFWVLHHLRAAGVSRQSGEFRNISTQDALFRFNKLMLHMPKAPKSKINADFTLGGVKWQFPTFNNLGFTLRMPALRTQILQAHNMEGTRDDLTKYDMLSIKPRGRFERNKEL